MGRDVGEAGAHVEGSFAGDLIPLTRFRSEGPLSPRNQAIGKAVPYVLVEEPPLRRGPAKVGIQFFRDVVVIVPLAAGDEPYGESPRRGIVRALSDRRRGHGDLSDQLHRQVTDDDLVL